MKSTLLCIGVVGLATSGCGVRVSDGDQRAAGPDARPGSDAGESSTTDAPEVPTTATDDAAPAGPACSNGRVVFLEFGGVTLLSTNVRSDATINAAIWAGHQLAVPPYHNGSATRASDIIAITNAVRAGLSAFPVTVVTTRPAAGPYIMIAFGGKSTVNFNYSTEYYAINQLDCGDASPSDVGWVSDIVASNQLAADNALGAIGFGLGLSGTTDPNTCMCGWNSNCDSADVPCTFLASSPAAPQCPGAANPQNEVAAIDKAFCRPL